MPELVIKVEGLSKRYRIGQYVGGAYQYRVLRDVLADAMCAPFRRLQARIRQQRVGSNPTPMGHQSSTDFIWALKDVSFAVKQGEVVGIIGRNGAGKTTLLKVLSRITEPTQGQAEIKGRVGSLLEIGTGFHPELTGRENIWLSGAILGMTKKKIDRKFDEIVAFAELEKFIDTPVKRYSSGMRIRLGFAVAAHLEPEILVVDEVLAVGDSAFQKKCLGKMGNVAKGGRTVLFVSHQMNSIRKLCRRCIWLDAGHIQMVDSTVKTVSAYEAASTSTSFDNARRTKYDYVAARFLRWEIVEPKAEQPNLLATLGPVTFKIVVQVNNPIQNGRHGIGLWNNDNQLMWGWATYNLKLEPGIHEFFYGLPILPLRPGVYSWHVSLYNEGSLLDAWHCVPQLIIVTEPLTHPRDEWSGVLNISCDFQVQGVQHL